MSIWSHGKTGLEFVLVPGGKFQMGSGYYPFIFESLRHSLDAIGTAFTPEPRAILDRRDPVDTESDYNRIAASLADC
ncbi:MAG: sulfatase activating formylglycine-generating enzyme [Verrucomicrobiales bacterium]|jgi:formylglycine-generating enzyme required for sulfatase activity